MSDRPNPLDGLEEWIDRMNRQLETAARSWESELDNRSHLDLSMGGSSTQLDLADTGAEFVVTVDVPGYETDDLELRVRGETLEISGERDRELFEGDAEGEAAHSAGTYIRRERETRSFSRQVRLPEPVDIDAVTAGVNNGILTVRLPKREPTGDAHEIDIE
ncbi:Hsp20 family protein [Natronorubrum sp. JWXQ-INN-674]|uniref:Hsp20 family protein n=1 Tax=Natronorubrum halalkaliphilum TaxID=2691917 RepID=A0A6B0VH34_9EURY|nr:Hsp20/alpha crystallin family protein [Natronorubrum halalkaliphilum]MXV60733.1 Hsp20 family protein [Natronorubrum halalkaliphilum]